MAVARAGGRRAASRRVRAPRRRDAAGEAVDAGGPGHRRCFVDLRPVAGETGAAPRLDAPRLAAGVTGCVVGTGTDPAWLSRSLAPDSVQTVAGPPEPVASAARHAGSAAAAAGDGAGLPEVAGPPGGAGAGPRAAPGPRAGRSVADPGGSRHRGAAVETRRRPAAVGPAGCPGAVRQNLAAAAVAGADRTVAIADPANPRLRIPYPVDCPCCLPNERSPLAFGP